MKCLLWLRLRAAFDKLAQILGAVALGTEHGEHAIEGTPFVRLRRREPPGITEDTAGRRLQRLHNGVGIGF